MSTNPDNTSNPSAYLRFLPSIYRTQSPNTGLYLKIFEKIFSGIQEDESWAAAELRKEDVTNEAFLELLAEKGLGELLEVISDFFFPRFSFLFDEANSAFLPPFDTQDMTDFGNYVGSDDPALWLDEWLQWIAGWAAWVLNQNWDLEKKRLYVASMLPLFRKKGTSEGLLTLLTMSFDVGSTESLVKSMSLEDSASYDPKPASIVVGGFVVRKSYEPGHAVVGGVLPYSFVLTVVLHPTEDTEMIDSLRASLESMIEQQKPAHCHCTLDLQISTLVVGQVKVAVSSLVGNSGQSTQS